MPELLRKPCEKIGWEFGRNMGWKIGLKICLNITWKAGQKICWKIGWEIGQKIHWKTGSKTGRHTGWNIGHEPDFGHVRALWPSEPQIVHTIFERLRQVAGELELETKLEPLSP